mgnify:FL=1
MNNFKSIGRYLFTVPFALFGLMHLMMANDMAGMVPTWLPGGVFWVYLTGLALIAAGVSFVIQKHTYLAGLLTAALMLVFVLTIHLPGVIGGNMMAMSGLLKDLGLAGGALMLASNYQQD